MLELYVNNVNFETRNVYMYNVFNLMHFILIIKANILVNKYQMDINSINAGMCLAKLVQRIFFANV